MTIRVCDICEENMPNISIEYSVNATKVKSLYGVPVNGGHVDICDECLKKIIKAKENEEE